MLRRHPDRGCDVYISLSGSGLYDLTAPTLNGLWSGLSLAAGAIAETDQATLAHFMTVSGGTLQTGEATLDLWAYPYTVQ